MQKSHNTESYNCWLQYKTIEKKEIIKEYRKWVSEIQVTDESRLIQSATSELENGLASMLGFNPVVQNHSSSGSSIILGTYESVNFSDYGISTALFKKLGDEGY